jgi:glyoxylase-like metal-dependent hydrolase (beta-lactamase superfamily II)
VAIRQLVQGLHLIDLGRYQCYAWVDEDGITLIDAGEHGSEHLLEDALTQIGHDRSSVQRLVLTHFHDDHAGGAAAVASWGVPVFAHHADAPIIRGEQPGPPPNFTDWERALHAQTAAGLRPAPPAAVEGELHGGDVLPFAGGAQVIPTPGHTDGSIALFLPGPRAVITGDIAARHDGEVILGVFNLDAARAARSFRLIAQLDVDVACFGHGAPVLHSAAERLRAAAERLQ